MAIDILLAAHLIGLMMGAGGGFGSMIAQRQATKLSSDEAGPIRALGPAMAQFSGIGLILMLATGFALVFTKYNGFTGLPVMFWVKMLFVTTLTLASIGVDLTYNQIKAGNAAASSRLPALGPVAGLSSLLAVIFAVLAFH